MRTELNRGSRRGRDDPGYPAGWLFDQLAARLGADRVFKDVDSIEPGGIPGELISLKRISPR